MSSTFDSVSWLNGPPHGAEHLFVPQVGLPIDPTLVRLADLAKAAAGLQRAAPAARPKVVVAQRRHTRVLADAAALAAALVAAGMEASVQEFGSMTFLEQARPIPTTIHHVRTYSSNATVTHGCSA